MKLTYIRQVIDTLSQGDLEGYHEVIDGKITRAVHVPFGDHWIYPVGEGPPVPPSCLKQEECSRFDFENWWLVRSWMQKQWGRQPGPKN